MAETPPQNQTALKRPVRQVAQQQEEKKERIKLWMGGALIIFALCVDLTELVITWLGFVAVGGILSSIVSVVAGFIFWIWFMLLGVPAFSNPKQFAVRAVTFVGEIIPLFDAIPFLSFLWTIGTIAAVLMVRSEDKGGIIGKAANMTQGKIK
ncbi:MAG: hypothetical protein A3E02_02005 [Candidatus Zambryskibacteria bacterium RIFCSPHIGHO2_12_FULL_38_34]|nr:MAG: hypothetical protein A3D37_02685 [Candidatus Zambryskibacteria bacterium RIFCSPHIGHO2_02_FULL_38_22]OHA97752.1 MAG: hypothetical protein A3E02_02005 [Candidatus Zambryskibacteria bacterium RIFCSPHIGHO2_12_FULL_38_34]OHB08930.1 MAG: hypothetical protein A3I19_01490 [Candidatus Zambryskibacteria bacterium RIFCSPLOWO2_02_FULL_38_13]